MLTFHSFNTILHGLHEEAHTSPWLEHSVGYNAVLSLDAVTDTRNQPNGSQDRKTFGASPREATGIGDVNESLDKHLEVGGTRTRVLKARR